MGESNNKPQYTGMDKYPGWIATVITIIVGGIFLGALYNSAGHHGDDHGGDHGAHSEEAKEHKDDKAH